MARRLLILPSHTSLPSLMRNPPRVWRGAELSRNIVAEFCFRVLAMFVALLIQRGRALNNSVATFEFQPNQPAEFLQNLQIATRLFRDQAFRDRGDAIRVQPSVGKA